MPRRFAGRDTRVRQSAAQSSPVQAGSTQSDSSACPFQAFYHSQGSQIIMEPNTLSSIILFTIDNRYLLFTVYCAITVNLDEGESACPETRSRMRIASSYSPGTNCRVSIK